MAVQQGFRSTGLTLLALNGTTSVSTAAPLAGDGESVLIYNASSANPSIDSQPVAFNATQAGCNYMVPPGARMIITVPRGLALYASAVADAATTAKIAIMRGDGTSY